MSFYAACIVLSFVPLSWGLLKCIPVHRFMSDQFQLNQLVQLASNVCSQL